MDDVTVLGIGASEVFERTIVDGPRGRAYARVSLWPEPLGWVLTDIVVPLAHQQQGHGSELLREVTTWADRNARELTLSPAPEGGWMDYAEIIAWYERHGFSWDDDQILRRTPR